MTRKPTYEALEERVRELEKEVTKGQRAQDAVRQIENEYRTLVKHLPQKVFYKDKDSVYLFCNENYARDLKIEPEEIKGKTDFDFFPKELADKYRADDRAIMASGEPRDIEEHYMQDQKEVYVHTIKSPVKDEQGHVTGVWGIFRDITRRRRCEHLLSQSEKRLRALVDASTESTFLMRTDGTVLVANQTVCKRLGTRPDDLIGTNIYDMVPRHVAKHRKVFADRAIRSGEPVYFEDERNGRVIASTVYPVFDQHSKVRHLAIYGTDITEDKQAREALRQREAALESRKNELEEVNTALKVLLKQREGDKAKLEERVLLNVKRRVLPYVEKLKRSGRLHAQQTVCLTLLESNLNDLASPFGLKLSSKYFQLTPSEMEIAHFVKDGQSTKDIAEMLNLSTRTVEFHRANIRKKLGIKNERTSLRSHLQSLE